MIKVNLPACSLRLERSKGAGVTIHMGSWPIYGSRTHNFPNQMRVATLQQTVPRAGARCGASSPMLLLACDVGLARRKLIEFDMEKLTEATFV